MKSLYYVILIVGNHVDNVRAFIVQLSTVLSGWSFKHFHKNVEREVMGMSFLHICTSQ